MYQQSVVDLEILLQEDIVTFNIRFLNTGEIRQKRRSKKWVMKRIFQSELKTWFNNWDETVRYIETDNKVHEE